MNEKKVISGLRDVYRTFYFLTAITMTYFIFLQVLPTFSPETIETGNYYCIMLMVFFTIMSTIIRAFVLGYEKSS